MAELQQLINLLQGLPNAAVVAIIAYMLYKLSVVASIYATIKYVAMKVAEVLMHRKIKYEELRPMINGIVIEVAMTELLAEISRIKGKGLSSPSSYIHAPSVQWLREAINDKERKDAESAIAKAINSVK